MSNELLDRLSANAQRLMDTYPTSQALLNHAVQGAMPWAAALATRGAVPHVEQIETLATQLLAILMASQKPREQALEADKYKYRW